MNSPRENPASRNHNLLICNSSGKKKFLLRADGHTRTFRLAGSRDVFFRGRSICLWASFFAEGLEELSNHVNVAPPIVLTIAGFDPSAGAGVAADLKTIAAHNCYGVAAITALTVQSTQGVKSVHDTPAAELRAQLDALLEDIKMSAIKIGMLGHRGNAVVVGEFLDRAAVPNVVLDPIMKSTSGESDFVDAGGIKYFSEVLLKRATVVTPNIAEAEILAGMPIKDHSAMEAAARKIVERGAQGSGR